MPLSWFACANCGFWQRHFAPPDCPVCTDVRNELPADGWRFLHVDEVRATHSGTWREVRPGRAGGPAGDVPASRSSSSVLSAIRPGRQAATTSANSSSNRTARARSRCGTPASGPPARPVPR